ncbi:kynureninase [Parafrankia sp. BMG5.11]|uniref:kynureninase n=1 Tax=Parafrankia sp. BMG5.11 TaxID=222540 RepID=UPI00103FCB24|nr:kynureninase [Parafrankia sp. BMG5.11]TCJ37084.1 kynureninase [Parafrankia sp. BMG5.11]
MTPAQLDAADPLAPFRDRFALPEGVIYLDGNSLGARPKAAEERVLQVVRKEWGEGLITSWNQADWIGMPQRIGDKIGRLIGAGEGEVIACDSTSINVFKASCAALSLAPERSVILSERGNFPTDVYMMQGIETLTGRQVRAQLVQPDQIEDAIDGSVAAVLLTQVHYKTGRMRDMARITSLAHRHGAAMIWDLSHSAGAVPVDLTGAGADFAVGCGYKYLNGGPGAPGILYVAKRHQEKVIPALAGWFGHAAPFAFEDRYEPAPGIARFLVGTPPVLGMAALEVGVDLFLEADMAAVRAKSISLAQLFIERMAPLAEAWGFALASPADPAERGSQVSYRHPEGYAIMQALIERGVIGDFRAPDILRFGFTPLYTTHAEVAAAVEHLAAVMEQREWDRPEHKQRSAVT